MIKSTADAFRVTTQGIQRELGAFVVGARFSNDGRTLAFALGDGTVRLVAMADLDTWNTVEVHDGGILALAADAGPDGFVTGGDDGKLRRIGPDGSVSDIAQFGMKWVEQVATHSAGVIAAGVGKVVHLFDAGSGERLQS